MTRGLAVALVAAAAACSPSPRPVDQASPSTSTAAIADPAAAPTPTPTPTPAATTPAPSAAAPAPAPPPIPAPAVRSAVAVEPAARTALSATAETVVDPASTFDIELAPRLADARIVLLDAAEAHVAAKDVRELTGTTRLTLAPEAPLTPGSRYVLRIDGASVREMHDADGRAFAPIGFAVLVAGTPPPPGPKAPPKRKRRH